MNWLDIVLVVFLAITTVTGLINGLVRSVIPLVGIILAVVLAGHFYVSFGDWLDQWIKNPDQAKIAGFAIIFMLVIIIGFVIASILSKLLISLHLGWIDRLGGAALGFIIGGLICGALLAVVAKYNVYDMETTIQGSALATFFLSSFPLVFPFLPNEFDSVRDFFG
jgi:membrane protein required for colicin V production